MPHPLRSASRIPLAASSLLNQLLDDPDALVRKLELYSHRRSAPIASTAATVVKRLAPALAKVQQQRNQQRFSAGILPATVRPDWAFNGRVLYALTNSLPHSTAGYALRSHALIAELEEQGIRVSPLTRFGYPVSIGVFGAHAQDSVDGISYARSLPMWFPLSTTARLKQAVRNVVREAIANEVTVLHTTTPFDNALVVSRAAAQLGLPWIYEVRGEPELTWASQQELAGAQDPKATPQFQQARANETAAMRSASAVVTLSEVSKQDIVARGVPAEKIFVVPNAVTAEVLDDQRSQQQCRAELGLDPNRKIIGVISSLVGYEGIDVALRALALTDPEIHLLIVGDGEARPGLEELTDELGLRTRVRFVGSVPRQEVATWYAALDALLVPRLPFDVCRTVTPIKTLLASALGVPIIASDMPALREVTGGFETYFPAGDARSLAEKIEQVVNAPAARSAEQQAWLRTRTWNASVSELIRAYQQVDYAQLPQQRES